MSDSLFAFRKSWRSRPVFGSGAEREYVETGIVEAASVEDARKSITSRSSVLSLKDGVTLEILPIDFEDARRFWARYDREPLTDSHASTGAKLCVGEVA